MIKCAHGESRLYLPTLSLKCDTSNERLFVCFFVHFHCVPATNDRDTEEVQY